MLKPLSHFFGKVLHDPSVSQIQPAHIEQYLKWRLHHGPGEAEASAPILSQTVHFNLIEQYFTEPSSSHMSRATWTTIL